VTGFSGGGKEKKKTSSRGGGRTGRSKYDFQKNPGKNITDLSKRREGKISSSQKKLAVKGQSVYEFEGEGKRRALGQALFEPGKDNFREGKGELDKLAGRKEVTTGGEGRKNNLPSGETPLEGKHSSEFGGLKRRTARKKSIRNY